MATFFQSFRSSTMPKRLLRYALSKLELLEEETLDIENLEFALGRNTVFEFKDVGMRLKKLERLLNLPPAFRLQRAKVLKLTVTIPMDFYTSPITIEVDGVDIRVSVVGGDEDKNKERAARKTRGEPDVVPDTLDLAASFLETQPLAEKRKLEEALASETQDLGASFATADSFASEEDEPGFGTGQALSLPFFLADFLQGIIDRTQIQIRGVIFQLDVEVPSDDSTAASDIVAFQIALDQIDVEGVTAELSNNQDDPLIQPKEGKRHIALSRIRAYLISEANVFSSFSRSPSMTSPAISQAPSFSERATPSPPPPSLQTTDLRQSSHVDNMAIHPSMHHNDTMEDSVELNEIDEALLRDSEDALQIPYDLADEPGPEDENTHTPRASIYEDFPGSHADSYSASKPSDNAHGLAWGEWSSEPPPDLLEEALSTPLQGSLHVPADAQQRSDSPTGLAATEPSEDDDLARSQLFTHEEAESMYMSAFSQAESKQMPSQQFPSHLPGDAGLSPTSSPGLRKDEPGTRVLPEFDAVHPPDDTGSSPGTSELLTEDEATISAQLEDDKNIETTVDDSAPDPAAFFSEPSGPVQEDIPTPRGPTRLVKEIVSLALISIYVPSMHKHIHVQPAPQVERTASPRLARSFAPQVPGAFSVYSTSPSMEASEAPQTYTSKPTESHADDSFEVNLSPVDVRFDASLAFLLATVVGKLLEAVRGGPAPSRVDEPQKGQEKLTNKSTVKLAVEKISLVFLNQLGGVADTAERVLGSGDLHLQPEILLQSVFERLSISIESSGSTTETSIDLEKFRLGYATDDILSFDQSLQMRTSVMDKFPSPGADVSLKLIQTLDSIRTEITTLPLLVQLDLRRLDETFGWFGGLSSFLHMSSSMTASSSPSSKSQIQSPSKPRGVRFDTPINPDDKSASSLNKVDMRVGGFNLELRGKECSVGLETSAIKMVSRSSGMGFAISKARLAGPYLKNGRRDPPIMVTLGSLRFDYQNSPTAQDLERLLELIIPSKAKFDQGDNEIMVDTLLRQRRKGAVLRINLEQFEIKVSHLSHLQCLPGLGEELARLAIVAKYLPEDDRPGLLTLGKIMDARASLDLGGKIGLVTASLKEFEAAQITIPSLIAFGIGSVSVRRNDSEDLVSSPSAAQLTSPVLMVRMVGDEIEPVIKVQMRAVTIDYRVPTIMDVLGLGADATPQEFEASLAASVANLGDQAHHALTKDHKPTASRRSGDLSKSNSKPMKVDILSKDCLIGLNPLKQPSKLFIVLTDAHLEVILPKDVNTQATLHLNKASLLLTDDVVKAATVDERNTERQRGGDAASQQVADLAARGYVNICFISAAKVLVRVTANPVDGERRLDVEMRDDLLVLETCADSTQTLISLANALTPPTPPTKENKYRTKVVPVQNLLASIAPEAFGRAEGAYDFDEDFPMAQGLGSDDEYDVTIESGSLPAASRLYQDEHVMEEVFDAGGSAISINSAAHASRTSDSNFNISSSDVSDGSGDLDIDENYFTHRQDLDSKARIWNSKQNSYDQAPADLVRRSPLRVTVCDVHVIWHLFDGYDWARTRDEITRTVEEVQTKALERRKAGPTTYEDEEDDDTAVIGDYLFNSIYIGIPAQYDPRDLAQMVNADLNDNATFTETESVATTAFTATGTRAGGAPRSKKRLRLGRSKHHKISFELQGVNLDLIVFPPDSGETQSSIDVRVQTLEVYDMVPTSTWKKFATYDQDAGEREMNTSMVRLELLNVKPHRDLAASEMVLRVTLLPLRLHVDQDALDFITRFFEFKDDKIPVHSSPSDVPFLQRVEIMDIPVQLDFKPKRVDYGGLKSGRTTEFMNFVILDQAHMTLRHAIIYGVQGFDRMGKTLNDIWMPDVKRNQLPGVLAGLAPVRSLVNIGSGFKNLVEIPIKEYQKDGRIFRSLQMGATAFARTTGTEMVKLGAKLAIGTQTALQGAEGLLTTRPPTAEATNWDGDDPADADDHQKQISLYADQPTGVIQGLRGGYQSLMRDLHSTRDAIIAVPGEVMDSQSAQGLARVLYKRAPTIVFRPAIGASKAIGKTLIGATNSLDPQNRRRAEEKYKRH
ncbi:Autophagy-related protein 2 like [Verticillium longisporum]|nr:Autophagy-related protein 2 like [Verticillium longisporum]